MVQPTFSTPGAQRRPRIALLCGPMATVTNTAPLLTSSKARRRYGLDGADQQRFETLRPQRLGAPATVYVEQFSAHPLEADAADAYGPPDGYVDVGGQFHPERTAADDRPVFEVELDPEDGLYLLPYAARQADGSPWDATCGPASAGEDGCRQTFFPDASRLIEEIERFGVNSMGFAANISGRADVDVHRILPAGGYRHADPPEQRGVDYFPYFPFHLAAEPADSDLLTIASRAAVAIASAEYDGAIWLDASNQLEETTYWLGLVLDVRIPIVGICAPDVPHGVMGSTGDRNLVDAINYIASRAWADAEDRDKFGPVLVSDGEIYAAREARKVDARSGGVAAPHGRLGSMARTDTPRMEFAPLRLATHRSDVALDWLANMPARVPSVAILKAGSFVSDAEVRAAERLVDELSREPVAGIVVEGSTPYGRLDQRIERVLRRAVNAGIAVVKVAREGADGYVIPMTVPAGIAGGNLSSIKARLLLMASLLKLGRWPVAADPSAPTDAELAATRTASQAFQAIFDRH